MHMQKLQITVSDEELRFLEGVRSVGFSSLQEVIRCAALSYLETGRFVGRAASFEELAPRRQARSVRIRPQRPQG